MNKIFSSTTRGLRATNSTFSSFRWFSQQTNVSKSRQVSSLMNPLRRPVYSCQSSLVPIGSRRIHDMLPDLHTPTSLQKKILVFTKTYPDVESVPDQVRTAQMKKAMDKFRVKMSLYMIGACLVGCLIMVYNGKQLQKSGDSLTKRVLREQQRLKELEKAKSADSSQSSQD